MLPSYEEVKADKLAFAEATRLIHINTNPYNAKTLVQFHDREAVVVNPPCLPLSQAEMDRVYDLPYTRRPHPSYTEPIPAFEMIKDSVTIMRGCFGGCTFCSITAHQGRIIQSRSQESVLKEVRKMAADPEFSGVVSDIGGPTANMYEMRCTRPEVEAKCKRLSCVHPTICKLLGTDHGPLVELLRRAAPSRASARCWWPAACAWTWRSCRRSTCASWPSTTSAAISRSRRSTPTRHVLETDEEAGERQLRGLRAGVQEGVAGGRQAEAVLVPYYIASHPGSDLHAMIDLALFLKRNGYRPDQVQDFIPAPFDIATCMYYTGIDPFTKQEVYIARNLRDRKLQRALLQFFKPENYFEVRKALEQAGRTDLIGGGCDALIPAQPPKEALQARREQANEAVRGDHVHTIPNPENASRRRLAATRRGGSRRQGLPPRPQDRARDARARDLFL